MKHIMHFGEIRHDHVSIVGGKGANLGELTKAGFPVPDGFCVSTKIYHDFIGQSSEMESYFTSLDELKLDNENADQLEQIREIGDQIRSHLLELPMPKEIEEDVIREWEKIGVTQSFAVRSSATAEDLPFASFAGQQDTYLNIIGEKQLLQAIQKCWASLFTDRAISYRIKNDFDHRQVALSVVVQKMVFPEVSGIIFTADPISGHRATVSIDASFGLGEALVSGIVSADLYQVHDGEIIKKQIAEKKKAIYALPEGGTVNVDIPQSKQQKPALMNEKILELAKLGKKIEKHYGKEQDIEWCLVDGEFYIVQSRPITSLFPVPPVKNDRFRVFLSVGHKQMMTEPMSPLGISIWKYFMNTEEGLTEDFFVEAGSRLFYDMTEFLHIKSYREKLIAAFDEDDGRTGYAIAEIVQEERFKREVKPNPEVKKWIRQLIFRWSGKITFHIVNQMLFADPEKKVQEVLQLTKRLMLDLSEQIYALSGVERIQFIQKTQRNIFSNPVFLKSMYCLFTAMIAWKSIENLAKRWLGDSPEVREWLQQLNLSLPQNISTEMGLQLGDLADIARQHPLVVEYLQEAEDTTFYEGLSRVQGGAEFYKAFQTFMKRFGMRAPGEIDVYRTRWNESPTSLVPSILSHVRSVQPGEHRQKFTQGERHAEQAAQQLLSLLKQKGVGSIKVKMISRFIKLFRSLMGHREFPKYIMIQHFDLYKKVLLDEAAKLVEQGILGKEQEIFFLTLDEIIIIMEKRFDGSVQETIQSRQELMEHHKKLTPPRVLTSEGEMLNGSYVNRDAPDGALLGTAVSAGVVEGIARVVLNPKTAQLQAGEIMVAPFTDPGWTPLFQSAKGLVMEVGGMMTHGSVVAREYGIPAVVGVDDATQMIKDGQKIRVNGTEGYVQIIESA